MHEDMSKQVERLTRIMDGNGTDGLVTRIRLIEERLGHLEGGVEGVGDAVEKLSDKTTRLMMIGCVAAGSLGAFGQNLVKFLFP